MRSGTIAFIAGILFLQQFQILPAANLVYVTPLFLLFLFLKARFALKLICAGLLGFLWALWHAQQILAVGLPPQLEGRDIQLEGYIDSMPVERGRKVQFDFVPDKLFLAGKPRPVPGKVRLHWYHGPENLKVGGRWRFTVRLKRPVGYMNPGGFDYEQWLFSQRIVATGYIRQRSTPQHLVEANDTYLVQQLRQSLRDILSENLSDHPASGIVQALAIGHREAITQAQWETLRRTGTNHLVAISGLHIGLVAGLSFFLWNTVWRRLGYLPLLLAAPRAAAILAIFAAGLYAALAGWSLPTQRAMIMVTVAMLALFLMRTQSPGRTLAVAMVLVLVYDPLAVLSPGLWLSFGAVAVILFAILGYRPDKYRLLQWGKVQWYISLGLFPLLILFFHAASLVSPLANLVAVPLVSLLIVPLLLAGILIMPVSEPFGLFLIELAADALALLMQGLNGIAALPFSQWLAPAPGMTMLGLTLLGILILLLPRGWPMRWLGLVFILPILTFRPAQPEHGEFWFTLLDVGQGLSAVIQTQHHVLVYDTGPGYGKQFNAGARVVVPYLRQAGIRQVDTLLVSHGDNDHIGGVRGIQAQLPVAEIITSAPVLLQDPLGKACQAGLSWHWDGVLFEILSPEKLNAALEENNQSCVLRVSTPAASVLLPGDIELTAEQALLARYPARQLIADILISPHHGSKTSSSADFLAAVRPRYVLIPAGYRNRYRFPHDSVVQRYRERGIEYFDSARHGAIVFKPTAQGDWRRPLTWRQQAGRYWHTRNGDCAQNSGSALPAGPGLC